MQVRKVYKMRTIKKLSKKMKNITKEVFENKILNKILLGDALKILKELPNNCIHLAITSPPYNLDMPYKNHDDGMPYEEYLNWTKEIWKETKRVLVSGGRLCINIGENKRQDISYPTYVAFINNCVEMGMLYRGTLIWNKESAAKHTAWGSWKNASNPHVVPRHEYIIVFSKDVWKLENGDEKSDITDKEFMDYTRSIWSFAPETRKRVPHPAPFPKELPYRLIKFYSFPEQHVLDMFSGSGTVGVVAKELNRNFVLIDNSEEYCKLALERFNKNSQIKLKDNDFKNNNHLKRNDVGILDLR